MSEETPQDSPPESLISRYRTAQGKRRTVRRTISLSILLIVALYIVLIYRSFSDFRNHLPEFGSELSAEAALLMPQLIDDVQRMIDRLVPFYMDTFARTLSANEEQFRESLTLEFEALDRSAQRSWIKIEEAIAQLVIDQEYAARHALTGLMTEEDISRISNAYRMALERRLERFFAEHLGDHIAVGEGILANLEEISRTETDLPEDDTQFILGMMLELLGLQMQEGRGQYDYILE